MADTNNPHFIPPDLNEKLGQLAESTNQDVEGLVRQAIEKFLVDESISESCNGSVDSQVDDDGLLEGADWVRRFRVWATERIPRNPNVDDSRESVYEGCGE